MFDEFRPEPIAIQIVGDDDAACGRLFALLQCPRDAATEQVLGWILILEALDQIAQKYIVFSCRDLSQKFRATPGALVSLVRGHPIRTLTLTT